MQQFTNHTYDEIEVGASDTVVRTLTATDVEALALAAGDVEAFHLDLTPGAVAEAATAPGAAAVALVAGVLNRRLPGPGSAIIGTHFRYAGKVRAGDTLTVTVTARAKHAEGQRIDFDCRCTNAKGHVLVDGVATVSAPVGAHRVHEHRHTGGRAAAKRRARTAAAALRRPGAGQLRRRASLRLRFAAGRDRVGASAA